MTYSEFIKKYAQHPHYKAPTGNVLNTKSWQTEAPLRMLLNNLDHEVADDAVKNGSVVETAVGIVDEVFHAAGRLVPQQLDLDLPHAGVHHGDLGRGDELASPGHLVPSRLMTVRFDLLPETARPLRQRSQVRFHVGTAELVARVALLGTDELRAGQRVGHRR